jgi:hypothetical protein
VGASAQQLARLVALPLQLKQTPQLIPSLRQM